MEDERFASGARHGAWPLSTDSCLTGSDHIPSLPVNGASAPARSAEDVQRLLVERELPGSRGGMLVWAWVVAVPVLWAGVAVAALSGEWPWFFAYLLALLTGRIVSRHTLENAHRRAALLLPELDHTWLGPLTEATVFGSPAARAIARLRLTTVLPTANPAASPLTDTQRALLFDQLTPLNAAAQPDLVIAVLRYAAETGDHFAIDGAGQLARMRGWNAAQRRVRHAARGILPHLESAVAQRAAETAATEAIPRPMEQTRAGLTPEAQAWLEEAEDGPKKQPGMRFGFLLAVWGVIIPYCLYQTIAGIQRGDWLAALATGALTGLASQAHRLTLTPQQTRVAARLASIDDVQAVGYLAEMTTWPDDRIKSMALSALTRLLPRMKSADTHLLSTSQRALLYQTLRLTNARRHAEFLEALLKALEQVGDVDAIPFVRTLADSYPATLRQSSVVKAARECLPYLETCAQQNRNSQTLLRATASDEHENLLRPAAQSQSPAELLVRAAPASPGEAQ